MPALVAGIHVFLSPIQKTWVAGSSPAMTNQTVADKAALALGVCGRFNGAKGHS